MSELARFTLVRDAERREPPEGSGLPLLPSPVTHLPPLLDALRDAENGDDVQRICAEFVEGGEFVAPDAVRDHPLGRLSSWLRAREDRATVREIIEDSPLRDVLDLTSEDSEDDLWIELRLALAQSFLVAMLVHDTDATVAPALQRLLFVAALAAVIRVSTRPGPAMEDDRDEAQRENVHRALHRRRILLPAWLSRRPELTAHVDALPRRSKLVRDPAFSDYYVIEDEWARYEAAEVAHIENLLPRENKRRVHVRQTEHESTSTIESEHSEQTEKDTQQHDNVEFTSATQRETNLEFGLELTVDSQGQYGPTAVQTHLAAEVDGSLATAEQTATRIAHEVVSRASARVSDRTRSLRTTRALTRITETNRHSLDNTESDDPVVGVYRWVEQVRRLRVMRYPHRYLLEFLVPEPAAWWRWLASRRSAHGVTLPPVIPFTANGNPASAGNPELSPADMSAAAPAGGVLPHLRYAARYGAFGLEPPPQQMVLATSVSRSPGLKSAQGVTGIAKPQNDFPVEWNKDTSLSVPSGWEATSWRASVLAWHDGSFDYNDHLSVEVTVGAGSGLATTVSEDHSMSAQLTGGQVGPISSGTVPVGIMLDAPIGYHIAVEVTCAPTSGAVARWQQRTYEAVRQAYDIKQGEYREAASAATARAGVSITGLSPARAREVERAELKKHVISLMRGTNPAAPVDPWHRPQPEDEPVLRTDLGPRDELMFLEQALEWENMRYVHYPYFWTHEAQWEDLADLSSGDPLFAAFLRAGSTRVVVPARREFEDAVNCYTRTLIPWGGKGAPAPDEPGYLSVAEEVAALGRSPIDGTQVGSSWEIRLPTELTCLADDDLPTNGSGRIPAPPQE